MKSLNGIVITLRERINAVLAKPDAMFENVEEDTKRTLITPLIKALGWDIYSTDEVRNEFKSSTLDKPVDYAMKINGKPVLFFEAKSLKTNLDDRKLITQTVNYANVTGVNWCVLTNGDEYRIYHAHAQADVEEKLFKRIIISDEDSHDITLATLNLLSKQSMEKTQIDEIWRHYFIGNRVAATVEALFNTPSLIRLIKAEQTDLTEGQIIEALKLIKVDYVEKMPDVIKSNDPIKKNKKPNMDFVIKSGAVDFPLQISAKYKNKSYNATILQDGTVDFEGKKYSSISKAGATVREGRSTNGWDFWFFKDPKTNKSLPMNILRDLAGGA